MMPTSPRLSRLRRVGYSDDDHDFSQYDLVDSAWSSTDDLNEEGAALMDEKDAQEALALLDHNKRTFKDARDRQHQVRSSNNLSPILSQRRTNWRRGPLDKKGKAASEAR